MKKFTCINTAGRVATEIIGNEYINSRETLKKIATFTLEIPSKKIELTVPIVLKSSSAETAMSLKIGDWIMALWTISDDGKKLDFSSHGHYILIKKPSVEETDISIKHSKLLSEINTSQSCKFSDTEHMMDNKRILKFYEFILKHGRTDHGIN